MLEKRDTKDSLVPILLQALDLLIQSTPEAKEHYLDSQGEEVLERWNDHKNEQVNLDNGIAYCGVVFSVCFC